GDLASRLVRAFSTVSKGTLPFSDPLAPRSKSIQPSLKPSSICRRGVGFFIPCALNNFSHDSRGTTSMRTGRCKSPAKVAAISYAVFCLKKKKKTKHTHVAIHPDIKPTH